MDIYATFANTKDFPDEMELVAAWNEYRVDNNPDGYEAEVSKGLESLGDQLYRNVKVKITISTADEMAIFDALNPKVEIKGQVDIEDAEPA